MEIIETGCSENINITEQLTGIENSDDFEVFISDEDDIKICTKISCGTFYDDQDDSFTNASTAILR